MLLDIETWLALLIIVLTAGILLGVACIVMIRYDLFIEICGHSPPPFGFRSGEIPAPGRRLSDLSVRSAGGLLRTTGAPRRPPTESFRHHRL